MNPVYIILIVTAVCALGIVFFAVLTMSSRAGSDQEAVEHEILPVLASMEKRIMATSSVVDDIRAQVERETTVTQSAVTLLNQIKAALDAALLSGDQAALRQLATDLGVQVDTLAAAVSANTPTPPGDGGGDKV